MPQPSQSDPNFQIPWQKPIIYQNGQPNFDNQTDKKNLWDFDLFKKLLELNAGLLLLTFVAIVAFGSIFWFSKLKSVNYPQANLVSPPNLNTQSPQPKIAQSAPKPPIFINDQIFSIDKAFNSQPTQIKLTINGALKKEVFGYLPYWAVNKADEISTKLLTSISYFGLEIGPDGEIIKNGVESSQAWQIWQAEPKLFSFIRKIKNQRIKVYLTFRVFNNDTIEKLVQSPQAAQNFINNALYQISSKSLDGVNLDFEYSGTPTDQIRDKFSLLVGNLNKEIKRQYPKSILTVSTYARSANTNELYDVALLASNSDGLVIMGYDFHTPDSVNAGAVAPMGGEEVNLVDDINAYLEKVGPEKLILAVPYYGYDWPAGNKGVNAKVITGDVKVLSYAEIAEQTQKLSIQWDDLTQTPWYSYVDQATRLNRIVHFENTRSLGVKYDFINKKNLAGVGIWALGLDGRNTDLDQLLADKFAN